MRQVAGQGLHSLLRRAAPACWLTRASPQPLSAIFNLARILETPHTAAQISTLWTAYHASRSNGTGRGFLCAAVPVAAYEAMLAAGRRYPTFVLPLARDADPAALVDPAAQQAYEFFFLQWATHEAPPVPTLESETAPFVLPPATPPTGQNPPAATVIYTPLGEYKLRQEFAAPQLALTFYTELAHTHGVVLLRGELTATASPGADGSARYWLSQADAQLLTVALQKFYLWQGEGADGREQLLRAFHEHPADFQWEALLAHAKPV
jgi:ATP synthase F1 complex assembly factor 1